MLLRLLHGSDDEIPELATELAEQIADDISDALSPGAHNA